MLSRIAESMFWIGRYVERADDTARILEVHTQLMVEDPVIDAGEACRSLLAVMGVEGESEPTVERVLSLLGHDPDSPGSIVGSLTAARESARRARETLSTDMWQAINATWNMIPSGRFSAMRTAAGFEWVRERAAVISGLAESTMSRDEGWHFLLLGRSLERADMTARLVATAALSAGPSAAWPTTLQACGAHEAFLRTYRGLEVDQDAAQFLLLDRLFPRSVVSALTRAERCLENLDSASARVGFQNEALRLVGKARVDLEYRSLADVMDNLPLEMERLQRTCTAASEAVAARYFSGAVSRTWLAGV